MVRVRTHLDGRRQRLCRAAGQHLYPPARERSWRKGISRLAVHDGLERRATVGRPHLPAADRASSNPDRSAAASAPALTPRRSAARTSSRSTWAAPPRNARWSRTAGSPSTRSTTLADTSKASRSNRRSSTSSRSAQAAVRSPGSIRKSGFTSARRAPARAPGPVCYGRGGTEPTVTDANLVLGRLNAERFLGGEFALDAEAARDAIQRIAEPLGYTGRDGVTEVADGILSIATVIMAGAIKQVSVEHGLDPREFILFCYGGGGPLHASALARELSIPRVRYSAGAGQFLRDRHAARRRTARRIENIRRRAQRQNGRDAATRRSPRWRRKRALR